MKDFRELFGKYQALLKENSALKKEIKAKVVINTPPYILKT